MYEIDRDDYGFAIAIVKDGCYILHLDRGTDLHEKNIDWVVAALNSLSQDEPNDADALNTRLNEIALEIDRMCYDKIYDLPLERKLHNEYNEIYARLAQLRRDK